MPAVLHPAAHDEPCLYLPVFRGHLRRRRRVLLPHRGRAPAGRAHLPGGREARRSCSGLGVGESAGAGRPGARSWAWATVPTSSAWAGSTSTRAPRCWPSYFATYKERHPGPLALALVGPISVDLDPHPDIVITGVVDEADKWDIVHDALVAVSPSALESFSLVVLEAWVDRVPGPRQRHLRPDPRALRAFGRGAVVHLVPRVRGDPRPPARRSRACGPRWAPTAGPMSTASTSGPCSSSATPTSSTAVVARGRGTPGLL